MSGGNVGAQVPYNDDGIVFLSEQINRAFEALGELTRGCLLPPPGWKCTRVRGHEGPCAAMPSFAGAAEALHTVTR